LYLSQNVGRKRPENEPDAVKKARAKPRQRPRLLGEKKVTRCGKKRSDSHENTGTPASKAGGEKSLQKSVSRKKSPPAEKRKGNWKVRRTKWCRDTSSDRTVHRQGWLPGDQGEMKEKKKKNPYKNRSARMT